MIVIVSFILDNIVSNFLNYNSIFNPLFTLLSLVLIYPSFNKRSNNYYIYVFILGFIYDVAITNTLFLNAFIFILLAYFIKLIFNKIPYNYLSVLIITLCSIIYYRVITYAILIILNYLDFNLFYLFKSIYTSILLNIIYISILYLIINSKRLIFKRT